MIDIIDVEDNDKFYCIIMPLASMDMVTKMKEYYGKKDLLSAWQYGKDLLVRSANGSAHTVTLITTTKPRKATAAWCPLRCLPSPLRYAGGAGRHTRVLSMLYCTSNYQQC